MISEEKHYRTNDGKLHNSRCKAEQHIIDMLCKDMDSIITAAINGCLLSKRDQQIAIVESFCGTIENAKKTKRLFDKMLS